MIQGKSFLAIVPARSGSKGLRDKNVLLMCDKPMMVHTIEAALKSSVFDYVMVSTDSENYANIARQYGAEVPFLRSAEFSTDTASSWDVVKNTVEKLKEFGYQFNCIALLQPTSPLRNADDICKAVNLFKEKSAGAVVSVCEIDHPIAWMNTLDESLSMMQFIRPEYKGKRRQEMPIYYRLNGAIYIVDYEFIKRSEDLYREGCFAYVMPRERSVDIDTIIDFVYADALMRITKAANPKR